MPAQPARLTKPPGLPQKEVGAARTHTLRLVRTRRQSTFRRSHASCAICSVVAAPINHVQPSIAVGASRLTGPPCLVAVFPSTAVDAISAPLFWGIVVPFAGHAWSASCHVGAALHIHVQPSIAVGASRLTGPPWLVAVFPSTAVDAIPAFLFWGRASDEGASGENV